MKKYLKIIGLIAIAGIIAALAVYKFVYNKPHPDYVKATPQFTLTAEELFHAFKSGQASSQDYTGAVLQVRGMIQKIENTDSQVIAVATFDQGMFGDEGIRYTMLPEYQQEIQNMTPGQTVTIKGLCTGYNDTDVIMEKCSVIE